MKIELTNDGWKEITTKTVMVTEIKIGFSSIDDWVYINKKLQLYKGDRAICPCCRKSWEKLSGSVNLAFTNGKNRAICDTCAGRLL